MNQLQGSIFWKGTMNLINDVSSFLLIAGPLVAAACVMFFLARRAVADEQEGKMWTKRVSTAVVCGVAVGLVSGFMALITSYYK